MRYYLTKGPNRKNSLTNKEKLDQRLASIRAKKHHFFRHFLYDIIPFYFRKLMGEGAELQAFIAHCQGLPPRAIPSPNPDKPIDVSIIIPVYNQWTMTKACINSILDVCDNSINYEIILADDCSTDDTQWATNYYPGLIISRMQHNVGFLRNCNMAARKARGRYLLLLNNDTIVLANWLTALYDTLETDVNVAIAGSKMLFANGAIQEAGAIIFSDGSIAHVGEGCHRDTAIFNIQRDTDYVSGCSMLIRQSFWETVSGFDERYHDAYFEDCDLALEAHARSLRVVYQPASEVIHFKHRSYRFCKEKNYKSLQKKNLKPFLEKWFYLR